ncbi:hypothetical protein BJ170DRAFT_704648 [Xylariales sp. AK1849]|nr:hypothetical protein BJ170DRAFT_704648 [Xylariales sp. AK1849]
MNGSGLRIALIFDDRSTYMELGHSAEECDDMPFEGEIQAIRESLEKLGHHVTEVPGIKSLVACLASGDQKSWDLAFNMAEGFHGTAREAQVPGLLEAYQIPHTFSDAQTMALCQDTQKTKIVLQHYEIPTAKFIVVGVEDEGLDISTFEAAELSYPVLAKPVDEGNSPDELMALVERLRADFRDQAILVEGFLAGREITISILGTGSCSQVIGGLEWVWLREERKMERRMNDQPEADFAGSNVKGEDTDKKWIGRTHSPHTADAQVQKVYNVALDTWKALRCRDAGRVDTRFDTMHEDAIPNVLEINTIAGIDPEESFLTLTATENGLSYEKILYEIVESARRRIKEI